MPQAASSVPTYSPPTDGFAATALLVSGGSDAAVSLRQAALEAGLFIVELEVLSPEASPWTTDATPGSRGGCALVPGEAANIVRLTTDAAGHFLSCTLDLILRSNGVRNLTLAGDAPAETTAAITGFALRHFYPLHLAGDDIAPLLAAWRAERGNARGWQPDRKAADLLTTLRQRTDPGHTALVLIDVQNDFCAPTGATGRTGDPMTMIRAAVDHILLLVAAAREAGVTLVHVRAEYGALYRSVGSPYRFPSVTAMEPAVWTASAAELEDGARFGPNEVEVCLSGSWGQCFVDGLVPAPGEPVVTKHRFSAFVDTGLDALLRARGIRTVVLAGVTTNCCVESTAREATMRDYYLIVAEDCVAVKDHLRALHDASLESMRLYFGQVRPAQEMIDAWTSGSGQT